MRAQMMALLQRMRDNKSAERRWKRHVLTVVRPATFANEASEYVRPGAAALWQPDAPYWQQLALLDLDALSATELQRLLHAELEHVVESEACAPSSDAAGSEQRDARAVELNEAILRAPVVHYDVPADASSGGFERLKFLRKLYDMRLRQEAEHDAYLRQQQLLQAMCAEREEFREPVLQVTCVHNNVFVSASVNNKQVFGTSGGVHLPNKSKKTLDVAAGLAVRQVLSILRTKGITKAHVRVKGSGKARQGALSTLSRLRKSFEVLSVRDVSTIPHGGGRRKRRRHI
ncbi:MAG: hypothetical protein MHM6MM_007942 [Cercozoa sp. M6MM]